MRTTTHLLGSLALAGAALAVKPYCGEACSVQVETYTFANCSKSDGDLCGTLDEAAFTGTLALCIDQYCHGNHKEWRSALEEISDPNETLDLLEDTYITVLNNATAFAADGPLSGKKAIQPLPFRFTQDEFDNAYRSIWSVEGATVYITSVMSYVLLIIALAVLVPAGINHFFFARRSKRVLHKSGGSATTTSPAWSVWPRKWLFLPPLFKKHNSHRPSFLGFSVTIPTRFETVCIVIYLLVNALGCGLGIDPFKENAIYDSQTVYIVRMIADKTGVMCIYNLPLLILFAGRNNILISVTGIPFSTFNLFHRMIGRVAALQAIIHSILYLVREGVHKKKVLSTWFIENIYTMWGAVAALCGVIIVIQGTHSMRRLSYEFFLLFHILLAGFFLIGAWYHLRLQDGGAEYKVEPGKWSGYVNWLVAALVLWGLDRLARLVKISWFSFGWSKTDGFQVSRGALRLLPGGFIEISVKMARDWTYVPGQYCFVHLPSGLRYLQSHPFTILSYDAPSELSSRASSQEELKDEKALSSDRLPASAGASHERRLKMIVRPQKGITSTLAKLCDQHKEPVVLVEGPYGNPFNLPLMCYDNATFVSGGIGFTAVFPHVKHALSGQHHQLHWICIIRTVEEAEAFRPYLAEVAGLAGLQISLYNTSDEGSATSSSFKTAPLPGVTVHQGPRPHVPELLEQDTQTAGSLAVVACGPGRLLDDVRRGVTDLISTKREHIELFSEAFEW